MFVTIISTRFIVYRISHHGMVNPITSNHFMKSVILWIIIPVSYICSKANKTIGFLLYQHKIYLSDDLPITKCQQIDDTIYQCGSITELFQQLSNCCNSTDVYIEPGNYDLAVSYELADLHDIRIRSELRQSYNVQLMLMEHMILILELLF